MAPPWGRRLDVLPALLFVPYRIRLVPLIILVFLVWNEVVGNVVPAFAGGLGSSPAMALAMGAVFPSGPLCHCASAVVFEMGG